MKTLQIVQTLLMTCLILFTSSQTLKAQVSSKKDTNISKNLSQQNRYLISLAKQNISHSQSINKSKRNKIHQCEHFYTLSEGNWNLDRISHFSYNDRFLIECEDKEIYKSATTKLYVKEKKQYDELGNQIECVTTTSSDKQKWTNESRIQKEYDEVRTDRCIARTDYIWDSTNNHWVENMNSEESYFINIVRDEKNRVIKNTKWNSKGQKSPLFSYDFLYNQDGSAKSAQMNTYDESLKEFTPSLIYEDMKWHHTDNQFIILSSDITDILFSPILDNQNQIKSYSLYLCDENGNKVTWGDSNLHFQSELDNQNRLKIFTIKISDGTNYENHYEYDIDEYGSFIINEIFWIDENNNGKLDNYEDEEINQKITTFNEYGDIISEEVYGVFGENDRELYEGSKYDRKYENGAMTELILSSYYVSTAEYVPQSKTVYSDFKEGPVGIENTETTNFGVYFYDNKLFFDNEEGIHYTIYNLNGYTIKSGYADTSSVDLKDLSKGLYIVNIYNNCFCNTIKIMKK